MNQKSITAHLCLRDGFAIVMMLIVLAGGCSNDNRRSLHGAVTLDEQPLPEAVISFQPAPGNPVVTSGATTDKQGKFTIPQDKGLMPGEYKVTIQKWIGTGRTFKDIQTGKDIEITAPIQFKESGNLRVTIADDRTNKLDFHLTSVKK